MVNIIWNMSRCMRIPTIWVSDQVRHKQSCTVTEDGQRLEILDLKSRGICSISVSKTKALISFAVTAKLICTFAFACADCWFSHVTAQILSGIIHFINWSIRYLCLPPTGSGDILFFPVRLSVCPSVRLSVCPSQIVSAL